MRRKEEGTADSHNCMKKYAIHKQQFINADVPGETSSSSSGSDGGNGGGVGAINRLLARFPFTWYIQLGYWSMSLLYRTLTWQLLPSSFPLFWPYCLLILSDLRYCFLLVACDMKNEVLLYAA